MKSRVVLGILALAVALVLSTTGHAYYWNRTPTDSDEYAAYSGEGASADSDYGNTSWASASAEITSSQSSRYGGAYAYEYWTYTLQNYSPTYDPWLVAHVSAESYANAWASGTLGSSDYAATGAGEASIGGYSTSAGMSISSPDDGDIDTDWDGGDILIHENGYSLYCHTLGYATAQTLSTSQYVHASAHGDGVVSFDFEEVQE